MTLCNISIADLAVKSTCPPLADTFPVLLISAKPSSGVCVTASLIANEIKRLPSKSTVIDCAPAKTTEPKFA